MEIGERGRASSEGQPPPKPNRGTSTKNRGSRPYTVHDVTTEEVGVVVNRSVVLREGQLFWLNQKSGRHGTKGRDHARGTSPVSARAWTACSLHPGFTFASGCVGLSQYTCLTYPPAPSSARISHTCCTFRHPPMAMGKGNERNSKHKNSTVSAKR
jgi:hypothetical protein